jgi:PmbA protein
MTDPRETETAAVEMLHDIIARALAAGADAADAIRVDGVSLSVSHRLGRREDLERSEGQDLGLRVLIGRRQAIVSSTDLSRSALDALTEQAVAMARVAPEDPHCGLADESLLARDTLDLDLLDAHESDAEELYARAAETEDAARAVAGITNSEGADASWGRSTVALATSGGFCQSYSTSSFAVSAAVVAAGTSGMERDYEYSAARHLGDLDRASDVGRMAGERTVARRDPRRPPTGQVPVVFDPRLSGRFLGHFTSAVSGTSIARGTSFLKDQLGSKVFADGIRIIDDPHRRRGLASKPWDGEGVANGATDLVEDGVLKTWVLDTASAHQLGMRTTGHASRGTSAPPAPATTNVYMAPGKVSRSALMGAIASGFYVTELIGFGVNPVTGDYSRGAAGFWIENGEITYPVSEATIAGNLKDMFLRLTPADDLAFRYAMNAPTLRVDGLTVAGA